jgi:uncharacterized small protein (DUF1192 family)
MAKAILGHVGGSDPRLLAEVARLRRRVGELQAEIDRLTAENQALLTGSIDSSLEVLAQEPLAESLGEDIITLDGPRPERTTPALT